MEAYLDCDDPEVLDIRGAPDGRPPWNEWGRASSSMHRVNPVPALRGLAEELAQKSTDVDRVRIAPRRYRTSYAPGIVTPQGAQSRI